MDERPTELARFADATSSVEPDTGARERVLRGVRQRVRRRERVRRGAMMAAVPVAAAAAVLAAWAMGGDDPVTGPVRIVSANQVERAGAPVRGGEALPADRFVVGTGGELRAEVSGARVAARGPSELTIAETRIEVHAGAAEIDGRLRVEGAGCIADVDGRCEAEVVERKLQVTVFAGSIEVVSAPVACSVIDLDDPRAEVGIAPTKTTDRTPTVAPEDLELEVPAAPPDDAPSVGRTARIAPTASLPEAPAMAATGAADERERDPGPSVLAEQNAAYRAALATAARDPRRALEQLRDWRSRWPGGALRHEVDLKIVDLLTRLGDRAAAAREARAFLATHPASPRASEIRRIADADM